jgi:hypothetical protein
MPKFLVSTSTGRLLRQEGSSRLPFDRDFLLLAIFRRPGVRRMRRQCQ